ncbi:protein of unknown function [Nitrospina watsonii]|uniref:Uncharacterized protein n=1 Tax=Nitrospina watsonii TaxID=1323948 RepID=A0ABM9HFQ4_9BACT|nr:protein of unknown function [Nitrospina watsonii]
MVFLRGRSDHHFPSFPRRGLRGGNEDPILPEKITQKATPPSPPLGKGRGNRKSGL